MRIVIYITYCVYICASLCVCVCVRGRGLEGPQTVMIINMIINNIKVKYVYPGEMKRYSCVLLRSAICQSPAIRTIASSHCFTHAFYINLRCRLSAESTDNKYMVLRRHLNLRLCKKARFEGAALILVPVT